jgi:hypothetical protein
MHPFVKRIKEGPLLGDGAMGTYLYAKGVSFSRCFDELNITSPHLVGQATMITSLWMIIKPTLSAPTVELLLQPDQRVRGNQYEGCSPVIGARHRSRRLCCGISGRLASVSATTAA